MPPQLILQREHCVFAFVAASVHPVFSPSSFLSCTKCIVFASQEYWMDSRTVITTNRLNDCILSEIGTGAREQDHTTEYSNGRQSVLSRSRTGARRLSNETNFTAQTNTDAIANIISRYKLGYFTYKFHTNILKFFSPFSSIRLLYNIFKSWLTHVTFIRLFVHCALLLSMATSARKHYNGCRSPSPVRWPGMCCLTTSETRRSVPTISGRR